MGCTFHFVFFSGIIDAGEEGSGSGDGSGSDSGDSGDGETGTVEDAPMMGSTVRFDNGEETTTNALGMFNIPVGYEGGFSASGGVNAWTSEEMDESWVIVGHTSISNDVSPLTDMAKHFMDDGDSVEIAMDNTVNLVKSMGVNLEKNDLFGQTVSERLANNDDKASTLSAAFNAVNNLQKSLIETIRLDVVSEGTLIELDIIKAKTIEKMVASIKSKGAEMSIDEVIAESLEASNDLLGRSIESTRKDIVTAELKLRVDKIVSADMQEEGEGVITLIERLNSIEKEAKDGHSMPVIDSVLNASKEDGMSEDDFEAHLLAEQNTIRGNFQIKMVEKDENHKDAITQFETLKKAEIQKEEEPKKRPVGEEPKEKPVGEEPKEEPVGEEPKEEPETPCVTISKIYDLVGYADGNKGDFYPEFVEAFKEKCSIYNESHETSHGPSFEPGELMTIPGFANRYVRADFTTLHLQFQGEVGNLNVGISIIDGVNEGRGSGYAWCGNDSHGFIDALIDAYNEVVPKLDDYPKKEEPVVEEPKEEPVLPEFLVVTPQHNGDMDIETLKPIISLYKVNRTLAEDLIASGEEPQELARTASDEWMSLITDASNILRQKEDELKVEEAKAKAEAEAEAEKAKAEAEAKAKAEAEAEAEKAKAEAEAEKAKAEAEAKAEKAKAEAEAKAKAEAEAGEEPAGEEPAGEEPAGESHQLMLNQPDNSLVIKDGSSEDGPFNTSPGYQWVTFTINETPENLMMDELFQTEGFISFAGDSQFMVVNDQGAVYWPAFNFNGIGSVAPGVYQLNFQSSAVISTLGIEGLDIQ